MHMKHTENVHKIHILKNGTSSFMGGIITNAMRHVGLDVFRVVAVQKVARRMGTAPFGRGTETEDQFCVCASWQAYFWCGEQCRMRGKSTARSSVPRLYPRRFFILRLWVECSTVPRQAQHSTNLYELVDVGPPLGKDQHCREHVGVQQVRHQVATWALPQQQEQGDPHRAPPSHKRAIG